MKSFILILVSLFVNGNWAKDLPLLNNGDVHLMNLTDSSVVLVWRMNELNDNAMKNTSEKLRLLIHLETEGKPPIYITPEYDNNECSITLSRCLLTFLKHDTKYRVIVSIDDVEHTELLGYAHIEFTTHPIENSDKLTTKVLLYVVLPGVVGFVIIILTLVIVCAKCCRRKRVKLIDNISREQSTTVVSNPQELRVSDYYDEAYAPSTSIRGQESQRYLPVISGQHPNRPQQLLQMESYSSNDSSTSGQAHLYLDKIIAQQQLQQHQSTRHHSPQHYGHQPNFPHSQRFFSDGLSSSEQPRLDNDGYLEVIDPRESESLYSNGLNML